MAEPTPDLEPENVSIADESIPFDDGRMVFVKAYMEHARSAEVELAIAEYNNRTVFLLANQ